MTRYRFVLDSSAWIEYIRGTKIGEKVKAIAEDSQNTLLTPAVVCTEVISLAARSGDDPEKAERIIRELSFQPDEKWDYFFEAGKRHFEMRKKHKEISLVDAAVKVIAEKNNATLVTKDFHLQGDGAIYLRGG